jgi:putative ABC transport system ATP-binding protein
VSAALVTPWLRALGLGERLRQPVGRLSGGARRRAAIARALATGRGLVVLDEPTSALDEAGADALGVLLRAVAHEHGRTVVCATHDPVLAAHADGELALGGRPLGPGPGPAPARVPRAV